MVWRIKRNGWAKENSCPFVDNELPYGRAEPGHPVIVDYFYMRKCVARKTPGDATQKIICEIKGSDMERCFNVRTFF